MSEANGGGPHERIVGRLLEHAEQHEYCAEVDEQSRQLAADLRAELDRLRAENERLRTEIDELRFVYGLKGHTL